MPIASASDALVRHLRDRLAEAGALDGWEVEATTLREVREGRTGRRRRVALALWRVQPDEPARDDLPARVASEADPPDGGGLVLRYLLLARGDDGRAEQTILGRCMAVLHQHPVVEEPGAPGGLDAMALVVTIETPPDDTYRGLAAACGGLRRPAAARRPLHGPQRAAAPADGRPPAGPAGHGNALRRARRIDRGVALPREPPRARRRGDA